MKNDDGALRRFMFLAYKISTNQRNGKIYFIKKRRADDGAFI